MHGNKKVFWEGKKIQNVDYWFKALRCLSKLLNFLPQLRPEVLETRLLMKKNE